MALIICPECGKEYSDLAPACPNCACPTHRPVSKTTSNNDASCMQTRKKHNYASLIAILIFLSFVVVGGWCIHRAQSYNNGLKAMYSGAYTVARNYLENLDYKDSKLVLNDISFLERLEEIAKEKATQDDENFDVSTEAVRALKKLSKFQTMEFHTDGLDTMLDQYIEGLERIKNASDYETASAVEFEILAGTYFCDYVIVNLHDSLGFMDNSSEYEVAYSDILPREEAFLDAFSEIDEKGHVVVKDGNFWSNSVTLFLRNDTDYTSNQTFVFDFYSYSGDDFLESVTTDALKIEPNAEYTVSIDVPQSARNGYNVKYSYYILDIDLPN